MNAYAALRTRFARISTINEAAAMLNWDASAMMPPGGGAARGDQLAVLAGIAHQILTEPATGEELAAATPPADPWDQANLRLMRRSHLRATALPTDLVEAQSRAASACEKIWRTARKDADFKAVLPYLAEVIRLTREAATALAAPLGLSPYDALMDGHVPGITAADATPIFDAYEKFLAENLASIEARQAAQPAPIRPSGPFPAEIQEKLCRKLSALVGLDYDHARLDRSAHPFCGGIPSDVRITTRYNEDDFTSALMGVLHETGHALYERHLPQAQSRQPVGEAAGMATHESQSLIVEMQACRSDGFFRFLAPELTAAFGPDPAFDPANLARLSRRVERSFIRVDADEVTYPAHVMMRFRLEQALISGDLAPSDLPGAWNESLRKLLGITPPDDALGCLQDIHWYDGGFGYFPSYTLGAMAAAQLMQAARQANPGLDTALEQGDLSPLTNWLHQNIHQRGSLLGFNDLLREATGRPLTTRAFETHLRARYLA